jgi:hypothetical protein
MVTNSSGDTIYYKSQENQIHHRVGGPYFIRGPRSSDYASFAWAKDGAWHRLNAPAIIYVDKICHYYYFGTYLYVRNFKC